MRALIISTVLVIVLLASCGMNLKEQLSSNNYFPLKTGNYWIYTNYVTDVSGQETFSSYVDSIVVVGDTLISGANYYVLENYRIQDNKVNLQSKNLRVYYAGYLLDENGEKLMSSRNFSDTLTSVSLYAGDEDMCKIYLKMSETPVKISVPAGEFNAVKRLGILQINDSKKTQKQSHTYYTSGIGKVMTKYPNIHSNIHSGQKLLRYQIN